MCLCIDLNFLCHISLSLKISFSLSLSHVSLSNIIMCSPQNRLLMCIYFWPFPLHFVQPNNLFTFFHWESKIFVPDLFEKKSTFPVEYKIETTHEWRNCKREGQRMHEMGEWKRSKMQKKWKVFPPERNNTINGKAVDLLCVMTERQTSV